MTNPFGHDEQFSSLGNTGNKGKNKNTMNKRFKRTQILFAGLIAGLFSSCSTSSLYNVWRDPSFISGPINRILVVTVKHNAAYRRYWEDGLVNEFAQRGLNTTPSYVLFGDSIPPINALLDSVQSYNFEYILLVSRVPEKKEIHYRRGHLDRQTPQEYEELRTDYRTSYEQERQETSHPVDPIDRPRPVQHNHSEEQAPPQTIPAQPVKVVRHEIKLYSTSGIGKLIRIGTGEVIDPSSSLDVNEEIIDLIGPELEAEGLIPAKKAN